MRKGATTAAVRADHQGELGEIRLPDGAIARAKGRALELTDREGRLLVRYEDGRAEISAASGDLVLNAAQRVIVRAGMDICLEAEHDVVQHAGRRVELASGEAEAGARLSLEHDRTRLESGELSVEARGARFVASRLDAVVARVTTTAHELVHNVERYELTAGELVERTRDSLRETIDLAEVRVGRLRTLVRDVFSVHSRKATLVSKDETQIDGSKILLG